MNHIDKFRRVVQLAKTAKVGADFAATEIATLDAVLADAEAWQKVQAAMVVMGKPCTATELRLYANQLITAGFSFAADILFALAAEVEAK